MDIIDSLLHEHDQIREVLDTYHDDPLANFHHLRILLGEHTHVEESVLYAAAREYMGEETAHAVEEHSNANKLLAQLEYDPTKEDIFDQLKEAILHHVEEEEGEYFPECRKHFDAKRLVAMLEEAEDLF